MTDPDGGERIPIEELGAAQAAANAVFWLDVEWATARWAHGDDALPDYDGCDDDDERGDAG